MDLCDTSALKMEYRIILIIDLSSPLYFVLATGVINGPLYVPLLYDGLRVCGPEIQAFENSRCCSQ